MGEELPMNYDPETLKVYYRKRPGVVLKRLAQVCICMCVCERARVGVYVYVCMYVYIYIYIYAQANL